MIAVDILLMKAYIITLTKFALNSNGIFWPK